MDNQHQLIKGYRDLKQEEIDLINKIKAHAEATQNLLGEVQLHLSTQSEFAPEQYGELARIKAAEPGRWASIARTHLQEGFMALVRAVAQPQGF